MKTICPYCKYEAECHEELEDLGDKPKNNDFSFCINCGEISRFSERKLIKVAENRIPYYVQERINKIRLSWSKANILKGGED